MSVILREAFTNLECKDSYTAKGPGKLCPVDLSLTVMLHSITYTYLSKLAPLPATCVCLCVSEIMNSFLIFQVHKFSVNSTWSCQVGTTSICAYDMNFRILKKGGEFLEKKNLSHY